MEKTHILDTLLLLKVLEYAIHDHRLIAYSDKYVRQTRKPNIRKHLQLKAEEISYSVEKKELREKCLFNCF